VDLLAYQDAARVDRRAALDELTRDAVAARAYDRTTDEFRDALKRSRRRRRSKAVD
jgi:hypothetical protein